MTTHKLDAQIKRFRAKSEALRNDLEDLCRGFIEATKEFVAEWAQTEVERAVTSNPEVTKRHGLEGLRNLKSDLRRLIARVPEIVEEHVNTDKRWPHRGEIPRKSMREPGPLFGPSYIDERDSPDTLSEGIREVFGYVGSLLEEYDYITGDSPWEKTYGAERPRYTHEYDWSDKMTEFLKRYSGLFGQFEKVEEQLKEADRRKAEAEAKALWEKA